MVVIDTDTANQLRLLPFSNALENVNSKESRSAMPQAELQRSPLNDRLTSLSKVKSWQHKILPAKNEKPMRLQAGMKPEKTPRAPAAGGIQKCCQEWHQPKRGATCLLTCLMQGILCLTGAEFLTA